MDKKSCIPKFKVDQKNNPTKVPPLNGINRTGLRRSKSYSDLKPLKEAMLNTNDRSLFNKPGTSKVGNVKSSSITNLNAKPSFVTHLNAKPSFVTHLNAKPTSITNLNAKPSSVTNLNAKPSSITNGKRPLPTIPERSALTKRLKPDLRNDTQKENQAKAPVKVPKPASYDYKGRFNLLTEKHSLLQSNYKDTKQELTRIKKDFEIEEGKRKELGAMYETTKTKNESILTELCELKEKFTSNLNTLEATKYSLLETTKKYETADAELNDIKEEHRKNLEELQATKATLSNTKSELSNTLGQLEACKDQLHESESIRRELNDTVQNLKGNIRVFCRVRPPLTNEYDKYLCNINYMDEATLELKSRDGSKNEFMFDKVFPPEASQTELFEDVAGLVQSAVDGYHVCVFAYGQTGSGKTYTMQGEDAEFSLGMIPRSMDLLFARIKKLQKVGWEYTVEASFLEIYNETIRDLLDVQPKQHDIRYNEGKGVTVTNLKIERIASVEEFRQLMQTAWKYRAVAATNFNEHSSRSHAVTKIYISGMNKDFMVSYRGSLNLIDLAGSESAKTSSDERLRETKNINRSLSALGTVILALHNKDTHVPFRNSKLTYLLQSCLSGNSKTLMVVNVSPFEECYNETINSLRFAFKVKSVHISSRRNKTYISKQE